MRSARRNRTLVRGVCLAFALTMLATVAHAGPADTREKISDAKARLALLEERIASQQTQVLAITDDLRSLARVVGNNRRAYETILARLVQTQAARARIEERHRALREEIARTAAAAYMRGNGYALEALLGADSISEVTEVLAYVNAISARNAELAEEAAQVAYALSQQEHREAFLLTERNALLDQLDAKQEALTARFVDQQERLGALARDRAEAAALLVKLRKQLRAEELAAAEEALRNGTPLTFGEWAKHFLTHIKAPVARNNLVVMVAWQVAEYTQARWNPLATTYDMPGSTEFNGHGVRNYVSLAQGLEATKRTLIRCCYGYEKILAALARDAEPMTTGEAINQSRWCYGCADGGYVIDLIPTVERYYDDYAAKSA